MPTNKRVVEAHVVCDEDAVGQHLGHLVGDVLKARRILDHLVGDAGERFNTRRDGFERIDQSGPTVELLCAVGDHDADLGDAPRFGGASGGFDVNDGVLHDAKMRRRVRKECTWRVCLCHEADLGHGCGGVTGNGSGGVWRGYGWRGLSSQTRQICG